MTPTWRTADRSITLYLGDNRDVLPTLNAESVDCCFTSPPYNLGMTTGGGHYKPDSGYAARGGGGKWRAASRFDGIANGYGEYNDAMPHEEYVAWQQEIIELLWRLIPEDGAIFYNHKQRVLGGAVVTPLDYLPQCVTVRQVIIWARAGGINFSPTFYCPTHEWVVLIAKPEFRLKSKGASGIGDVWYIPQEENADHPAPFPLELPLKALSTIEASRILDPFMGSGTTGVACIRTGRKFVGIEKEEKYFAVAVKRIEAELKRNPLFEPPPVVQREFTA